MYIARLFVTTLVLLSIAACSSLTVKSKELADYNWGNAKTYAWESGTKISVTDFPEIDTATLNKFIRSSIDKRLAELDFKRVSPTDNPDLIVTYLAAVRHNIDVHETPKYYNEAAIERRQINPSHNAHIWATGSPRVVEYTEGALGVVLKDARTKTELWQSVAKSVVDLDASQKKRQSRIDSASKVMFKSFPK